MLNKSVFAGRLTRDAELKYTANGKAVAQFNVATNRNFKNSKGEYDADFFRCLAWGKNAENLSSFTHKGSLVNIESHYQTSSYLKDGERKYRSDFIVDHFDILEPKKRNEDTNNNTDDQHKPEQSDPFADNSTPIDISDDDLPF